MDRPLVESLLDSLPLAEMAAVMKMDLVTIRNATRGALLNAIQSGVTPAEARRRINLFMESTIHEIKIGGAE